MECVQNFGEETSYVTSPWKTEKKMEG